MNIIRYNIFAAVTLKEDVHSSIRKIDQVSNILKVTEFVAQSMNDSALVTDDIFIVDDSCLMG